MSDLDGSAPQHDINETQKRNSMRTLDLARQRIAAGISVLPIAADGSKAPAGRISWKHLQDRFATDDELQRFFANGAGIGTICGAVSGNLEIVDIDDHDLLFKDFIADVELACPGLSSRLTIIRTPNGDHVAYRCETIEGNQKLAQRAKDDPLFSSKATLIETRGQGGYVVAPGSPAACHESGRTYEHLSGPEITSVNTITPAERSILFRVARTFNRFVDEGATVLGQAQPRDGLSPGDDFSDRATWAEILEPHGWQTISARGEVTNWRRPGKSGQGTSATTGLRSAGGNDLLCVFSSNAHPFDVPLGKACGCYSKFAAFALLNHGGDYSAAAKALANDGYGERSAPKDRTRAADGDIAPGATWLPTITNADKVGEGEDQETHAKTMAELLATINRVTDDWPRRVGNTLFIDDPEHGLGHLAKIDQLFGWLSSKAFVSWYRTTGCVARGEVFSELQRTAKAYRAIEAFPHFPAFGDHYYCHPPILEGNGDHLRGLLDRFCPATPIDRDLILAMFASAAWGGEGGTRPAFVVSSDDGRGVGKTTLVEAVGQLMGGMFAINKDDRAGDIDKRLLTPEAATKRVVGLDNVKINRLSWGELEARITAREISGHQMYSGERTRPNTLLWCITLNGPSLSKDMAQRSVIVKLSRPEHSGDWEDELREYIESNRWAILADLKSFLNQTAEPLAKHTRWGKWERDILARLPEPAEAQRVIAERQASVDADDDEAADIEDHFRQELERLGYDPDADAVHIPNGIARDWYTRATGHQTSATGVTRAIRQASDEGTLASLKINPCRKHGRGLLWAMSPAASVSYDLEQRQRDNSWRDENRHWDR